MLESEARIAAQAGYCETVRRDLSELATIDPARRERLVAEQAVAACTRSEPPPPPVASKIVEANTVTRCALPLYLDPSVLFGDAYADRAIDVPFEPPAVIGRLAAGWRQRVCRGDRRLFQFKLGGVVEAGSSGSRLYGAYGAELTIGLPVEKWFIGPRGAVEFPENAVALWLGVRAERGPVFVGADVVRVKTLPDHRQIDATGIYATVGATGKVGGVVGGVAAVVSVLAVASVFLFCCQDHQY